MASLPQPLWNIGTILYRKVSCEAGGMLTGYIIRDRSPMTYLVAWAEDGELEHYGFELQDEKSL